MNPLTLSGCVVRKGRESLPLMEGLMMTGESILRAGSRSERKEESSETCPLDWP